LHQLSVLPALHPSHGVSNVNSNVSAAGVAVRRNGRASNYINGVPLPPSSSLATEIGLLTALTMLSLAGDSRHCVLRGASSQTAPPEF